MHPQSLQIYLARGRTHNVEASLELHVQEHTSTLCSVVVYAGDGHTGHYWTYARHDRNGAVAWWKYDDVRCRQVSQQEVLACPGGYGVLLFYSKMPAAEATSSLATNSSDRAAAPTGASEETRGSSNPTQKEAAETGMGEAEVERERNHAKDRASEEARGSWSSDRVGEAKAESGEAEVGQKREHAKAKALQEVAGAATLATE